MSTEYLWYTDTCKCTLIHIKNKPLKTEIKWEKGHLKIQNIQAYMYTYMYLSVYIFVYMCLTEVKM